MRARGDHRVFSEPFSIAYYFGPEQVSERFGTSHPEATFESVLRRVLRAARDGPVFVKEMAYQLGPLPVEEVVARVVNTFLIRDPAFALPSLAARWPDFTGAEAGYAAQHELWRTAAGRGLPTVVIDSDDLRADPEAVAGCWCDAVGIERRPDALLWKPGMPEDWRPWAEWMTRAAASTGFDPPSREPAPPIDAALEQRVEDARLLYVAMAADRLQPRS